MFPCTEQLLVIGILRLRLYVKSLGWDCCLYPKFTRHSVSIRNRPSQGDATTNFDNFHARQDARSTSVMDSYHVSLVHRRGHCIQLLLHRGMRTADQEVVHVLHYSGQRTHNRLIAPVSNSNFLQSLPSLSASPKPMALVLTQEELAGISTPRHVIPVLLVEVQRTPQNAVNPPHIAVSTAIKTVVTESEAPPHRPTCRCTTTGLHLLNLREILHVCTVNTSLCCTTGKCAI